MSMNYIEFQLKLLINIVGSVKLQGFLLDPRMHLTMIMNPLYIDRNGLNFSSHDSWDLKGKILTVWITLGGVIAKHNFIYFFGW